MTSAGPGLCGPGSAALTMPPGSGERVFPARPEQVGGLEIVRRLASESGVAGSMFTGWEAWATLDWPGRGAAGPRGRR
jgi:hypothetical protein